MENFNHDVLVPTKVPEEVGYPGLRERREVRDGITIDHDTVETTEASETWHR